MLQILLFIPLLFPFIVPTSSVHPPATVFACLETIDAGNDTTFCFPGGTMTLNGSFSGNEIASIEWSPVDGLSDPTILNPLATVSQTTTYTLTILAPSPSNLIFNGDFEAGNTGFNSDYWVGNPGLSPGGYSIQSNPVLCNGGFSPCGDHTSGSGNMMVVDGATAPGVNIWCQTVNVLPNTNYFFEFWVTSLYPVSPPDVQASFNGLPLGSVMSTGNTCEWIQFSGVWFSGGASNVTICLENLNLTGFGNDFAIDDIFLYEMCEYEDEVTITVLDEIHEYQSHQICFGESVEVGGEFFSNSGMFDVVLPSYRGCDSTITVDIEVIYVEAFIQTPDSLSCLFTEVSLDGSLSNGSYGINSFQWTTLNGNILSSPSGPSVSVGSVGTYHLLVSSSSGGITCYDSITVTVGLDTSTYPISILDPLPLSCQDSVTTLTAVVPLLPSGGAVDWSSADGLILSGHNTLSPSVLGIGTYTIVVTNPFNGCTSQQSVEVIGDTLRPILVPGPIPLITCRDTNVTLHVQVIQPDSGFISLWTTSDGQILTGVDSLSLLVGKPGAYTLVITDTLRGCSASLTLNVAENKIGPLLDLPAADTLGCQEDSISISLSVLPDSLSYSFLWSTPNGLLLSANTVKNPVFGAPGNYVVLVENTDNGCRDSAYIGIIRYEVLPLADAGPDLIINCLVDSLQPLSLASDQGPGFSYQWTLDGAFLDSVLQPWIHLPGTYILQVSNNQNRCLSFDTLVLSDIRNWPDIVISAPSLLTCALTETTLDASASDAGIHTFLWSGPSGGLLSGHSSLTPTVVQPGWYILTSIDTSNHCVSIDSVLVAQDIIPPLPIIEIPDSLDCNHPQVSLFAENSAPSGSLSFLWSSSSGNILSGATTSNPIVNGGGWYLLTLTNTLNGCDALDSVWVYQDPNLPVVSILDSDTLTCAISSIQLTASIQAPGSNISYLWTTTDGQILSGANSLNPTIGQPGTYSFVLTDLDTGCEAFDVVTVHSNIVIPQGSVVPPLPLNCIDSTRLLVFQSPIAVDALWSTTNGSILGDPTQHSVQVNDIGSYLIHWTNPVNGCSDSLLVSLSENRIPPVADAGPDAVLPCDPALLSLDASASSGQGTLNFLWSSSSGQIVSGGQDATPMVSAIGTYFLRITDEVNGCVAVDSLVVTQDLPHTMLLDLSPPSCRRAEGEVLLIGSAGGANPYSFLVDGQMYPAGTSLLLASGTWPIAIMDALGCRFDSTIVMPDRADLTLVAPPEVWVVYGDSSIIELSSNFPSSAIDTVLWEPPLYLSPTADKMSWHTHATLAMQYQVTIKTIDGCEASGLIQVLIDHDPKIFIPNVFSPGDGNGLNDLFFPNSKPGSVQQINSMTIYDRWGNQIFSLADFPPDDASFGWNGFHKGQLMNPAVFIWVIEALMDNGEVVVLKGDVTLK